MQTHRTSSFDPILGDLSLLGEMRRMEVKGNLVHSRPRYVAERHGEGALRSLAAKLPEVAAAYLLKPPFASAWVGVEPLMHVDRAIVEDCMGGDLEQMRGLGEEIAAYDLSTVYRMFLKAGVPAFVLQSVAVAYATYLRPGEATASVAGNTAELVLDDATLPLYLCQYGVVGWLTAALQMSGATSIQLEHTECRHRGAGACRWQASWTPPEEPLPAPS